VLSGQTVGWWPRNTGAVRFRHLRRNKRIEVLNLTPFSVALAVVALNIGYRLYRGAGL
jgi:hypothetical protein